MIINGQTFELSNTEILSYRLTAQANGNVGEFAGVQPGEEGQEFCNFFAYYDAPLGVLPEITLVLQRLVL
jgi:hypothetical protein